LVPARFLDTNILLRYMTRDDEAKAQKALALLQRVESGEERVETSLIVIFEVVFTLERFYKVPREQIHALVTPIIALRGLRLASKSLIEQSLDLYARVSRQVSFADIYNAQFAQSHGIEEIYSWDHDFDEIDGITRVEPNGDD
jgi:predicted nucleic acid-binding protein